MRQLPCAGGCQDDDLNDHPANDTRVGRLGLVSELGLSFLSLTPLLAVSAPWQELPRDGRRNPLTLWKTCSRRISCSLEFRSLTRWDRSSILPLSVLSICEVSPMARSSCSLMPPLGWSLELSQPWRPLLEDGVKQILCSPASAALKVKRPAAWPRFDTTRWLLSKISYTREGGISH